MDYSPFEEYKKLHKLYLYSDYSISDLAKYLDISRRTVERWLSGKYLPSENQLKLISDYLLIKSSDKA